MKKLHVWPILALTAGIGMVGEVRGQDPQISNQAQLPPDQNFKFQKQTVIDPGNPQDPDGIWRPDEIRDQPAVAAEAQELALDAPPKIVIYALNTPEGQRILSILVNDQCSTDSCPVRDVLIKPDGSKEVKSEGMAKYPVLPREAVEGRGPGGDSSFYLAPDGQSILETPDSLPEAEVRGPRGEGETSLINAGIPKQCAAFAARVSGSEGNFTSRSTKGCLGAFQFCPGTFEQYYKGTAGEFLQNPQHQVAAWQRYLRVQWNVAQRAGLTSLIGQDVTYQGKTVKIDDSAILMACQFGCGKGGKLSNYLAGRNCEARNVKDGFGTSVCSYLTKGAEYNVSCFTGRVGTLAQAPNPPKPATATASQPASAILQQPTTDRGTQEASTLREGYFEVVTGRYTLRFPVSTADDVLRRVLDTVERR
jgi:hypothetical protein